MRQRVMIAMALACRPKLLIADEPTTALDVTIQAQILELMRELKEKVGSSIMLITHDLGVVSEVCSRVVIFYCGQVVEEAPASELFQNPLHPYTEGLLHSLPVRGSTEKLYVIPGSVPSPGKLPQGCVFHPRCKYATERCRCESPPYVQNVGGPFGQVLAPYVRRAAYEQSECFSGGPEPEKVVPPANKGLSLGEKKYVKAVDDVSFQVYQGGDPGVGGRVPAAASPRWPGAFWGLIEPTSGEVLYRGDDIVKKSKSEMKRMRQHMQIVFQDPYGSLHPKMRIGDIIEAPLVIAHQGNKEERRKRGGGAH